MERNLTNANKSNTLLNQLEVDPGRLAFGCWRLAGTWDPNQVNDERRKDAEKAVLSAIDSGYTTFDHADIYCEGAAESLFGDALKNKPSLRDQLIITSKCGIRFAGQPDSSSPYRYDSSKQHIIASCEASLKRLRTDRLDVLMIHRPDFLGNPHEIAEAIELLKSQGKVRLFGASNFTTSQIDLFRSYHIEIATHQIEISLVAWHAMNDGRLDQCLTHRMTPMAWSPLAKGLLGDGTKPEFEESDSDSNDHLISILDKIAQERSTSRSSIALAWLLRHPSGIMPVIGSTNPERIKQAAKSVDIILSRDEWYQLTEAAIGNRLP